MTTGYLDDVKKQFAYYKSLGEKTFAQVPDEGLFWQYNEETNSIAIIVKHLWGNMLSRWTDFLTTDGEKTWRERDKEFENNLQSREQLLEKWKEGWNCLFKAINSISEEDLETIIYIRNEGHTILEAINRQISHYSYHVGQIVFISKMLLNEEWQTLSIARNKSNNYNEAKFEQAKSIQHFT